MNYFRIISRFIFAALTLFLLFLHKNNWNIDDVMKFIRVYGTSIFIFEQIERKRMHNSLVTKKRQDIIFEKYFPFYRNVIYIFAFDLTRDAIISQQIVADVFCKLICASEDFSNDNDMEVDAFLYHSSCLSILNLPHRGRLEFKFEWEKAKTLAMRRQFEDFLHMMN